MKSIGCDLILGAFCSVIPWVLFAVLYLGYFLQCYTLGAFCSVIPWVLFAVLYLGCFLQCYTLGAFCSSYLGTLLFAVVTLGAFCSGYLGTLLFAVVTLGPCWLPVVVGEFCGDRYILWRPLGAFCGDLGAFYSDCWCILW